jgi:hypothetical protein
MLFIGFVTDDSSTRSGQTTTKPPPAPKVRYEEYYVTAQKLNVRANPSADAAVIRQVSRFQTLNVSDVTDGWAKFRQPGFTSAYAAVRYLAKGNGHRAELKQCEINKGPQPRNGETLWRALARGGHQVKITGGSQPIVVKLKSRGQNVLFFYVAPRQTAQIQNIPDGTYTVFFASGDTWSRSCDRFVPKMDVSKDPEPVMMTRSAIGDYGILTYDLSPREGGNFRPTTVAENDF